MNLVYEEYQFQLVDTLKYGLTYIFIGDIIDDNNPAPSFNLTLTSDGIGEAYSHFYYRGYAEQIFLILGNKARLEFLRNIARETDLLHSFNLDEVEEWKEILVSKCENYSEFNLVFITRNLGVYCFFDFMKPVEYAEMIGFSSSGEKLILRGGK